MKYIEKTAENLQIKIFETRAEMGASGAKAVAAAMKSVLSQKEQLSMIFASAPSQNEFLACLAKEEGIDWARVIACNMDEYVGIAKDAPQGFGNFLVRSLYSLVKPGRVELFDTAATDSAAECERYAQLLCDYPPDIIIFGVGENGHLAFNDPPVADFNDSKIVKVVALDEVCRNQQINDGCYQTLDEVPTHAYTITIPVLLRAPLLFGFAPGKTKIDAITKAATAPVSTSCPATVLRTHQSAVLYTDVVGASQIL